MPIFFWASGAWTANALSLALLQRESLKTFWRARTNRLATTFLAGALLVVPIMYLIWALGWVRFGYAAPSNIYHVRFGPAVQQNLWGTAHLWSLGYLWIAITLLVGFARFMRAPRAPITEPPATSTLARMGRDPRVGALAWCAALPLCAAGLGWLWDDTLHRFPHQFLPAPGFLTFHLMFFAWGWAQRGALLDATSALRTWTSARWPILLLLALVVCARLVPDLAHTMHIQQNEPPPFPASPAQRAASCALVALGACLWLLGLLGAGTTLMSTRAPAAFLSRVARAGMWVYLTHLPWVGLSALALYKVPIPSSAKALLAFSVALLATLLTRPLAARTRAGKWLGA